MRKPRKHYGFKIIEIIEDGKTFVAHFDTNGSYEHSLPNWTRSKVDKKFRYQRCPLCGKLIPIHPQHWYSHFDKCFKNSKVLD